MEDLHFEAVGLAEEAFRVVRANMERPPYEDEGDGTDDDPTHVRMTCVTFGAVLGHALAHKALTPDHLKAAVAVLGRKGTVSELYQTMWGEDA